MSKKGSTGGAEYYMPESDDKLDGGKGYRSLRIGIQNKAELPLHSYDNWPLRKEVLQRADTELHKMFGQLGERLAAENDEVNFEAGGISKADYIRLVEQTLKAYRTNNAALLSDAKYGKDVQRTVMRFGQEAMEVFVRSWMGQQEEHNKGFMERAAKEQALGLFTQAGMSSQDPINTMAYVILNTASEHENASLPVDTYQRKFDQAVLGAMIDIMATYERMRAARVGDTGETLSAVQQQGIAERRQETMARAAQQPMSTDEFAERVFGDVPGGVRGAEGVMHGARLMENQSMKKAVVAGLASRGKAMGFDTALAEKAYDLGKSRGVA